MKIAVIGCGLRTPLLIYGLARSGLDLRRLSLYDILPERAQLMSKLGPSISPSPALQITAEASLSDAIRDCSFVISSIRVDDMAARARDERIAMEAGFAGQETTGPAGIAMAMRTVPVAIEHARLIENLAPQAWIINFTNPAGLITQAISVHTGVRVVGICDTPAELFFRIAAALGESLAEVECGYFGLNHLGWVSSVRLRGKDITDRVLDDDSLLRSVYPSGLFPPALIRSLRLIPTEYLFFYYRQQAAWKNQVAAAATRGAELLKLNARIMLELESNVRKGDVAGALHAYRAYLNRRNASYMHLEADGISAFDQPDFDWDPFEAATGYHRLAVDTISALSSPEASRLVLNVKNGNTIEDLERQDIVEVPCIVDKSGPRPLPVGRLPGAVRGLTIALKYSERLTIEAALRKEAAMATMALWMNPIIRDWDAALSFWERLMTATGELRPWT